MEWMTNRFVFRSTLAGAALCGARVHFSGWRPRWDPSRRGNAQVRIETAALTLFPRALATRRA
jgi:hypothetical protein